MNVLIDVPAAMFLSGSNGRWFGKIYILYKRCLRLFCGVVSFGSKMSSTTGVKLSVTDV